MNISGILNLIQNSRLIKTGDDLKPLAEPKDVFYLKAGDVLEGRIVRSLPDNRVVLSTQGREITARTNLPLTPGERIQVEVQSTKNEILLKVLNRAPSMEGLIKQELKPLLGTLHRPIAKVIQDVETAIQSILSSPSILQDKELVMLLNRLSSLLKELNVTPSGRESVQGKKGMPTMTSPHPASAEISQGEPSGTLSTARGETPLLKWIQNSGLEWENKVWHLFESPPENLADSIKTLIENDLKGLTQKIIDQLPQLRQQEEPAKEAAPSEPAQSRPTSLPNAQDAAQDGKGARVSHEPQPTVFPLVLHQGNSEDLTQLATHLEQLSQTIQVHQWMNAVQHDANQQFYFQIPLALSDGLKPLDLFIYRKKREGKSAQSGMEEAQQDFWVVFFLTLSTLGSLRIDLKTSRKALTVSILTGEEKAARHIAPFLPQLEEALGAIGFQVKGTKVEPAKDGIVKPPDPVGTHPFMRKGMVSIVA